MGPYLILHRAEYISRAAVLAFKSVLFIELIIINQIQYLFIYFNLYLRRTQL